MKNYLLFLVLLCSTFSLSAQITVDNETFPQEGDTLFTNTDNLPADIQISSPGPNQEWDFRSLAAPFTRATAFNAANTGLHFPVFPGSDVVLELQAGVEAYYKINSSAVEYMGYVGEDPIGLGIEATTRFEPKYIERRSPMNYGDTNNMEANLSLPFASEDIPIDIFSDLPVTPDSVRIRIAINRSDEVDAWGTVRIPGGIYDVLREKRTEIRETRIDALVPFFGWQDVTVLLPLETLGVDTSVVYYYFSNEAKEPIAIIRTRNNEQNIMSVEYKAENVSTAVQSTEATRPGIYAHPNPAIADVRFEFANLKPGQYHLKIYNILGLEIWEKSYRVNGYLTDKVNVGQFRKGTYLYSLEDEDGKTLMTKRLMVVRP